MDEITHKYFSHLQHSENKYVSRLVSVHHGVGERVLGARGDLANLGTSGAHGQPRYGDIGCAASAFGPIGMHFDALDLENLGGWNRGEVRLRSEARVA